MLETRPHQFDALVSFVYNTGSLFSSVKVINNREAVKVAEAMKAITSKDPKVKKGLDNRRLREEALYLLGDYGQLPNVG